MKKILSILPLQVLFLVKGIVGQWGGGAGAGFQANAGYGGYGANVGFGGQIGGNGNVGNPANIACKYYNPAGGYGPWGPKCNPAAQQPESKQQAPQESEPQKPEPQEPEPQEPEPPKLGNATRYLVLSGNREVATLNGPGDAWCPSEGNCQITLTKDLNADSDFQLEFYYTYAFDGRTTVKFCEASEAPPDSLQRNVWLYWAMWFAGNATECPIKAGTYDVPKSINFMLDTDEPVRCGNETFSVGVFQMIQQKIRGKSSNYKAYVGDVWAWFTPPENANCLPKS